MHSWSPLPLFAATVLLLAALPGAAQAQSSVRGWGWLVFDSTWSGATNYVGIAAGYYRTVARRSGGSVIAWDRNYEGQCDVPALPPGLTHAEISGGSYSAMARLGPTSTYTSFGMPGCTAFVSSSDHVAFLAGVNQLASWSLPIPSLSVLVGVVFYQQALVLDPASGNALGDVVSDATEAVIGA